MRPSPRRPAGPLERVVSGGQTGADRGALDAAIAAGLEHGGFCPRGRRAEDGVIPGRYRLRETESGEYAERTRRNVEGADATALFARGEPAGGSALTAELARSLGRPLLVIDLARVAPDVAATRLRAFVRDRAVRTLNVAGPRESEAPGIADEVRDVLLAALAGGSPTGPGAAGGAGRGGR